MSALIVGGDRIESYRNYLTENGFVPVRHWCGRKKGECHRLIPSDTRLIVVMTDQINHCLAKKIRQEAELRKLPIVFSKRSISHLKTAFLNIKSVS